MTLTDTMADDQRKDRDGADDLLPDPFDGSGAGTGMPAATLMAASAVRQHLVDRMLAQLRSDGPPPAR